ncbi:MAG: hypothetical protein RL385_2351 [Pseudomonadota bacterium]|jgi:cytochrome c
MQTPIPRDIPLPLPVNPAFAEILLVIAFIAHILFVNLMVGGSILVGVFQWRGLKTPDYDALARKLADTVTVNKSMAVVLGVAPLLLLNVLYTIHIYTANALTGTAWMMVVPLVTMAFLLTYFHKYTWDTLAAHRKTHIAINLLAVAIFLFIPFVFLANVNLMMFPEEWTKIHGFLSAVMQPNVVPRYMHFMSASLILTSLFGVGYFGRPAFDGAAHFAEFDEKRLRRIFYSVAFSVSLLQFVVGPIVLVTLPGRGMSGPMLTAIGLGATLAIPAVWLMWKELVSPADRVYTRLGPIVSMLGLTVVCMAFGRQMYRGVALAEHKRAMGEATAKWVDDAAQAEYESALGTARASRGESLGETHFKATCSGCHAVDKKLVGPSLVEIAEIYASDPEGIVRWAKQPGQKREGARMPSMAIVGDTKLAAIAKYMLEAGKQGDSSAP